MIELRFGLADGHPRTLEEVGREFGVTRERIRQIESKTLSKLRPPHGRSACATTSMSSLVASQALFPKPSPWVCTEGLDVRLLVNTRSRSRPKQTVTNGTPERSRRPLSCESAGQSVAWAFLDTEEVGGSNPPAPTTPVPRPDIGLPYDAARIHRFSSDPCAGGSAHSGALLRTDMLVGAVRQEVLPLGASEVTAGDLAREAFPRSQVHRPFLAAREVVDE